MTIQVILVLLVIALLFKVSFKTNNKNILFILSVLAIYWFQPNLPIRNLAFWLPTISILVIILSWLSVTDRDKVLTGQNRLYFGLAILIIISISATRYINFDLNLFQFRPPPISRSIAISLIIILLGFTYIRFGKFKVWIGIAFVIGIFILIKTPLFSTKLSIILRMINQQSTAAAAPSDLQWIGYSYIAFRLLHTLRDKQLGRYADVPFRDYMIFVLFPPSILAGPIDRIERFIGDLNNNQVFDHSNIRQPFSRIAIGLLKKFIVADLLSLISLNSYNGLLVRTSGWLWILVFAYSFQIYYDFSGYTDIVIGIGQLLGVRLPENFNKPYLQSNLTQFWNSWHISLTQWFRIYFFNPITRYLRLKHKTLSPNLIMTLGQFSTMLLIGLWHGIQPGFIIWGAWHAIGLYLHNRFQVWFGKNTFENSALMWLPMLRKGVGVGITFVFVSLGWVWFTISDPQMAFVIIRRLFGFW